MFDIDLKVKKTIKGFYLAKQLEGNVYMKFSKYYVRKCYLVEREHALVFLNMKNTKNLFSIWERHVTGTSLYLFWHDEKIPFWKLPEYGYERDWLHDQIEEHHINPTLKNYKQVLLYLKQIKQRYENSQLRKPKQLQLFD